MYSTVFEGEVYSWEEGLKGEALSFHGMVVSSFPKFGVIGSFGWWPMALKARGLAKFLAPRAARTCWLRVPPGAWGSGLGEPTSWPCGCDP